MELLIQGLSDRSTLFSADGKDFALMYSKEISPGLRKFYVKYVGAGEIECPEMSGAEADEWMRLSVYALKPEKTRLFFNSSFCCSYAAETPEEIEEAQTRYYHSWRYCYLPPRYDPVGKAMLTIEKEIEPLGGRMFDGI